MALCGNSETSVFHPCFSRLAERAERSCRSVVAVAWSVLRTEI